MIFFLPWYLPFSWIKWLLLDIWDSLEIVVVFVDVWLVVSWLGSLDFLSSFVSLLCFVDLSLGDGSVSGVWVHSVWSEVFSSSVNPVLIGGRGDVSSLVIGWNIHSSSVGVVLEGDDLGNSSSLLLELIKGPVWADINNILLFVGAFIFTVNPLAFSVILEGSNARTR